VGGVRSLRASLGRKLPRCGAYVAYAAHTAAPLSPTPHSNRTSRLPSLVARFARDSLAPSVRGSPSRSPGRATASLVY